jgi:hypothetical protein
MVKSDQKLWSAWVLHVHPPQVTLLFIIIYLQEFTLLYQTSVHITFPFFIFMMHSFPALQMWKMGVEVCTELWRKILLKGPFYVAFYNLLTFL